VKRVALVALLWLAACGGDDAPPTASTALDTPTTRSAVLAVTIEAQPVKPSGNSLTPLSASWTIVVQETGGIGGQLGFVNTTLRDATSGARAWPSGTKSMGSDALTTLLGTTRLPAGGTIRVPGGLTYTFVSGSKVGVLTAAVQVEDDNGHVVTALAETEVR
jgi:hypothetical protein